MKVELLSESRPPHEFQPVEIKLTISTIEEMRLLFHVHNNGHLWDYLKGFPLPGYSEEVARNFDGHGYRLIKDEVLRQGFKL